ncbi:MAG: hypothetical protein ACRBG0_26635 [Lewinella sp.]|uniref:hypothetical protein n=1 Tax=Lewinella sp. TaxID=2004506 RepID=UPI003D6C605D
MKDNLTDYSRDTFLELLKENFGDYKIENGIIIFNSTSNKEIAEALAMGEAQFSRKIRSLPDADHEYRRIIDRILLYQNATRYKRLKRIIPLLSIMAGVLALITIILFRQLHHLKEEPAKVISNIDGLYLSKSPSLVNVMKYNGASNIHRLKWEAVRLNQRIKAKRGPLTYIDSINEVSSLMTNVASIIRDERDALSRLNFIFPSGKALEVLLEEVVPIQDEKMFNYSAEEIISLSDIEEFEKRATFFDKGVRQMYPIVLNNEIEYHQIVEETVIVVRVIQSGIQDILNKAAQIEMISSGH